MIEGRCHKALWLPLFISFMHFIIACVYLVVASLLKDLRHTNIVTLHDIVHTKDTLTFVFEYVVSERKDLSI